MTERILSERLYHISQCAKYFPRPKPGKKISYATLLRYCEANSCRPALEHIVRGRGSRFTSVESIQRFLIACTEAAKARRNAGRAHSRPIELSSSKSDAEQRALDAGKRLEQEVFGKRRNRRKGGA